MLVSQLKLNRRVDNPVALADAARDAGDWPLAARHYREALDRQPDNAPIWVQYGHALKESGKLTDAEAAYRQSIELAPEAADSHLQLGHALKLQGCIDNAAASYLHALALAPGLRDASAELIALGWSADAIRRAARRERGSLAPVQGRCAAGRQIVFDISDLVDYFTHSRVPTGIQRVQINVISNLLRRRDRIDEFIVACFMPQSEFWVAVPESQFLRVAALSVSGGEVDDPEWRTALAALHRASLSAEALEFQPGATLINLGTSWWLPNYFLRVRTAKARYGIRYLPIVYDCIPVVTPEHCALGLRQDFIAWLTGVFHHADGYIAISRATAGDLAKVAQLLGHAIPEPTVIPLDARVSTALDETLGQDDADAGIIRKAGLERQPFVLFVGTVESRKNHLLAFNAWLAMIRKRGLRNTPALVCVGKQGWMVEAATARLESSELLQQKIIMLPKVSDGELAALYRRCLFTIFPSFYEGWGLPVTEALCHGKVPLTTAVSSLREAGGDFAEYFDHQSERDFLAKLERLIDDADYRREREARIRKTFRPRSWDDVADAVIAAVPQAGDAVAKITASNGDIWPLPVHTGRYYSLARNRETALWPGMVGGEMCRMGTGWWAPDDWGSWVKGAACDIAFCIADAADCAYVLYLGLLGTPRHELTYGARVVGTTVEVGGVLAPSERRWLALTVPREAARSGVFHLQATTTGKCDLREVTDGKDRRVVTLGVTGFYACRDDDLLARQRFLEALVLNQFDQVSGRPESAHDYFRYAAG